MDKRTFKHINMLQAIASINSKTNNLISMAEAKFIMWISYILGIPIYGFVLWVNLGTWKSDVLFAAGLFVLSFNVYWRYRRNIRADKKSEQEEEQRRLEMWEKQIELQERQQRINNKK